MAIVVFLRGVNVGGHRTFRPAELAKQLNHLGAINLGAAGTFVIRQPVAPTRLRAELARRLPFETEIVTCEGREIIQLMSNDVFSKTPVRPEIVRFVSILAQLPRESPKLPVCFPTRSQWLVKVRARDGRFVVGQYRRQMKAISYLGRLDRLFGVPATTRNWNTMVAIAKVLDNRR